MQKQLFVFFLCAGISLAQPWNKEAAQPKPPVGQSADSSQIIADKIVNSTIPVLIDFWAPWCGPCRILGPIIEEIKKDFAGKISVVKVNVDVHRKLAAYFKISAIPAVFIIKNKAVVEYLPGLQQKQLYRQAIEKVLREPEKKISSPKPSAAAGKPTEATIAPASDNE